MFRSEVLLGSMTLDLFSVFSGAAAALLPVFATDVLGAGPAGFGLLRSAGAAGSLAAALLAARLLPRRRAGLALHGAVAGFGVCMVVFGLSRSLALSVAALFAAGLCERAIAAARAGGTIALSQAVFQEVAEVLSRPKFARILTDNRRVESLALLTSAALWIEPAEQVRDCRDAADNRYLELALAARATVIVSGNKDVLVLDPWRGVRVLTSTQFLEWLGEA